jgi:hypothetical protein
MCAVGLYNKHVCSRERRQQMRRRNKGFVAFIVGVVMTMLGASVGLAWHLSGPDPVTLGIQIQQGIVDTYNTMFPNGLIDTSRINTTTEIYIPAEAMEINAP